MYNCEFNHLKINQNKLNYKIKYNMKFNLILIGKTFYIKNIIKILDINRNQLIFI